MIKIVKSPASYFNRLRRLLVRYCRRDLTVKRYDTQQMSVMHDFSLDQTECFTE